jgi:hypothetical protein
MANLGKLWQRPSTSPAALASWYDVADAPLYSKPFILKLLWMQRELGLCVILEL